MFSCYSGQTGPTVRVSQRKLKLIRPGNIFSILYCPVLVSLVWTSAAVLSFTEWPAIHSKMLFCKAWLFLLPWSSLAIILWPLTSTRHFFPGLPDATIVCKWSVLCGKIPVISKLLTANYLSSPFLTLAGHWIAAMWLANYYAFVLTHSWTGVPEKMAGECIYHRNRNKSEKI